MKIGFSHSLFLVSVFFGHRQPLLVEAAAAMECPPPTLLQRLALYQNQLLVHIQRRHQVLYRRYGPAQTRAGVPVVNRNLIRQRLLGCLRS